MLKVAIKGVLAHKRRLLSTSLAVLLGVSFLCGTLVMSDTIQRTFSNLLATVNSGTDAFIRSRETLPGENDGPGSTRTHANIDESLVATVQQVPGVAAVTGQVQGRATIFDKAGNELGSGGRGAPDLALSWSTDAALNPFKIAEGRAPTRDDEVVIDRGTAKDAGYHVGDSVEVAVTDARIYHLVGIATFGNEDNAGGATTVLFTLPAAEALFTSPGHVDAILVRAQPGVTETELQQRISPMFSTKAGQPPTIEVLTGAQITQEQQDAFQSRIQAFTTFFSGFGYIAVLVGAFVIYNTFSILVAQRARETALLRAVGASRRQVLGSVFVEAFAVGLFASIVGVIAGVGVGAGLRALFGAFGFSFPSGGLVLRPGTVIVGLTVGLLVTMFAATLPALRASRIKPLAALRETAVDTSNTSRARLITGVVITALGVASVASGISGGEVRNIGIGSIITLIGMITLGPVVARPLSGLLGSPAPRLRGVTGRLARDNAMRNPRRTAGTATALMVGVAVVSIFAVLSTSLRATADDQITKSFVGDLVVTGSGRRGTFDPSVAKQLAALPDVQAAAPLRSVDVAVDGDQHSVIATDPKAIDDVIKIDVRNGSLADLGTNQIAVATDEADRKHLTIGSTVTLTYLNTGDHPLTVAAIFHPIDPISVSYIINTTLDDANDGKPHDSFIYMKLRDGANLPAARTEVKQALQGYPNANIEDLAGLKRTLTGRINSLLAVIFAMLTLSILIASIGISNTLQLSVHERTHELGLLRAVGTTRDQLRSMVRWESIIIAVFGTIGGLVLGDAFGWSLVHGLGRDQNVLFRIPVGASVLIVGAGVLIGVLAAARPARRAANLDVLDAIAFE